MKGDKTMVRDKENDQGGFSVIEVAIASIVSMIGMIFLASLFTLAIAQNRTVKQFTSTTALAQEKIEELSALEQTSVRLTRGGDLYSSKAVAVGPSTTLTYSNDIFVADSGQILLDGNIPSGRAPHYRRFWSIQNDPTLLNTVIISVRVVSTQSGRNTRWTDGTSKSSANSTEETTLTTVRSW
jgi:hypothetical protein